MSHQPREHIDTLRIHDAWSQGDCGCPLCQLQQEAEESLLRYYLSPAQMEADIRQESNRHGFCKRHLHQLLAGEENRLTLALVLETYLEEQTAALNQALKRSPYRPQRSQKPALACILPWRNKKKNQDQRPAMAEDGPVERQLAQLSAEESCLVCTDLAETMDLLIEGIFACYKKEAPFAQQFREAPYCLPHLRLLLDRAAEHLRPDSAQNLGQELLKHFVQRLQRARKDCQQFSLQFDYRYRGQELAGAKGALKRAVELLRGRK